MVRRCNSRGRIRTGWMALVAVIAITTSLSGCATPEPEMYRVGILSGTDDFLPIVDGFKAKMVELGYVEGENVIYDVQSVNADPVTERAMAEKLVNDKVDVILSLATESSVIAKEVTQGTDIPVVFAFAGLEEVDLVASVREPGGNITGVRYPGPEQITRRLELMLEIAPHVKRVWIGYNKDYPTAAATLAALRPQAQVMGVALVEAPSATIEEMEADLVARARLDDPGMDAIILMPDTFNHTPRGLGIISKFATEQKIPLGGSFLYTVQQGAVFGNANDFIKMGELAAPLVDKIFKGTPAGKIPVVTPEQDLWINYRVAQELGLTVPEGLLRQAAEIIR